MMQSSPLAIVTMRRDLSARYASTTRQWLAARNAYRRLHEQPVKNIIALRDAAQRLDFAYAPGGAGDHDNVACQRAQQADQRLEMR